MINIKNFDPKKIKIDEKSCKHFLIYLISYVTMNSVKPLFLNINKINEYVEENHRNKYLTLFPNDESKDTLKSMKNYGPKSEILLD